MSLDAVGGKSNGTDSRSANMKVITSIYLNCRPELRDEWLAGSDQDTELEDALVSFAWAPKAATQC